MQHKYDQLKLLEVELRQETAGPPIPGSYFEELFEVSRFNIYHTIWGQ